MRWYCLHQWSSICSQNLGGSIVGWKRVVSGLDIPNPTLRPLPRTVLVLMFFWELRWYAYKKIYSDQKCVNNIYVYIYRNTDLHISIFIPKTVFCHFPGVKTQKTTTSYKKKHKNNKQTNKQTNKQKRHPPLGRPFPKRQICGSRGWNLGFRDKSIRLLGDGDRRLTGRGLTGRV